MNGYRQNPAKSTGDIPHKRQYEEIMRRYFVPSILLALLSSACSGPDSPPLPTEVPLPGSPTTAPGIDPATGIATPVPAQGANPAAGVVTPAPEQGAPTIAPTVPVGPGTGAVPPVPGQMGQPPVVAPVVPVTGSQTRLRLLSAPEYNRSLRVLFGNEITSIDDLPEDVPDGGFVSIRGARHALNDGELEKYESAARAVVEEVFANEERWKAHVGCEPAAELDGACVAEYVNRFGRLAYRGQLSAEDATIWTTLAAKLAADSGDMVEALKATTAAMLQSPRFTYRIETAAADGVSDRFAYDALSMATRLAFLLTGATPTAELLTLAENGGLSTPEGVRSAAEALIAVPENASQMRQFFIESTALGRVSFVPKADTGFEFGAELRADLMTEVELWLDNAVLAPGADVRELFNGRTTFINQRLAGYYGVDVAGEGFVEHQYAEGSGRAGIFGKGGYLAAHSASDSSAPTRRGLTISGDVLCLVIPEPPEGVDTTIAPPNPGETLTTRQRFVQHQEDPQCAACHALIDPFGFALEAFDPIGRFRDTEQGQPIDNSAVIFGEAIAGAPAMADAIRQNPSSQACLVERFSKHANGVSDVRADWTRIQAMAGSYNDRVFNWREFLTEFVSSDVFRSTPLDTRTAVKESENHEE